MSELNALEEDSEELFVVIKRTSEEALMGEVAKKFPELKKISVNSYPHILPKNFFANLARLTKLESFTFRGDARMTDEDFETLGEMVQLKRLNFSLP